MLAEVSQNFALFGSLWTELKSTGTRGPDHASEPKSLTENVKVS